MLAGWFPGGWAATCTWAASAIGIYLGHLSQEAGPLGPVEVWNTTVRLLLLLMIGQFTARVRQDRNKLRGLLENETTARIATVEQLRHRDRLAIVGQISSGIAHEIGTPLNIITGRARLISEPDATLAEAQQHAAVILEQSERVTSIIRQLLDFSRRRGPQQEKTSLLDLTSHVFKMLGPLASKRGVELVLVPSSRQVMASIDSMQIEQALSNLVLNAIQSISDHGTVRVSVDVALRAHPEDESGRSLEHAVLTVEDNGTGIAKDHLSQIFEPFFTTQRTGEGTGLGLPITHEIIADHGGWIEVKSEQWKGSRFTMFLPKEAQKVKSLIGFATSG